MLQAILSSQTQVIFIPPVHFSIFIVQRGIIMPVMAGFIAGMLAPIPDIIPVIGFIVAVVMVKLLGLVSIVQQEPPWPPDVCRELIALSER
jgi:branched-subunit amino acid permease